MTGEVKARLVTHREDVAGDGADAIAGQDDVLKLGHPDVGHAGERRGDLREAVKGQHEDEEARQAGQLPGQGH